MNLALDYLPGSTMFDPAARDTAPADEASLVVWFDAFTQNVDRTPRNANLLVWHRKLYPIDHGAALFFHHDWPTMQKKIESPFVEIGSTFCCRGRRELSRRRRLRTRRLTTRCLHGDRRMVPDEWLESDSRRSECGGEASRATWISLRGGWRLRISSKRRRFDAHSRLV